MMRELMQKLQPPLLQPCRNPMTTAAGVACAGHLESELTHAGFPCRAVGVKTWRRASIARSLESSGVQSSGQREH